MNENSLQINNMVQAVVKLNLTMFLHYKHKILHKQTKS